MTGTEPTGKDRPTAAPGGKAGGPTTDRQEGDDVRKLAEVAEQTVGRHLLARGFLIGAVLTAAMTLFIVQNTRDVGFHWLWFDFGARLWLALLIAFAGGAVASPLLLAAWQRARRHRKEHLALTKKLRTRGKASAGTAGAGGRKPSPST